MRYAIVQNNTVVNVIMFDGNVNDLPLDESMLAIPNEWVGIGDWYEISEGRFYRPLPNNVEALQEGNTEQHEQ